MEIQKHTVAYRPTSKQRLRKQRPFLGNGSVNTFPLLGSRFLTMQQLDATIEELFFLCGPCWDLISNGQSQFSRVLYGRLWRENLTAWSWRTSIVRSRCQGTAGEGTEDLAGAVVICKLERLAVALLLFVLTSRVYKWSINPFSNPSLVYSHTYTVKYKLCWQTSNGGLGDRNNHPGARNNSHRSHHLSQYVKHAGTYIQAQF
jgi:hypothetical protein